MIFAESQTAGGGHAVGNGCQLRASASGFRFFSEHGFRPAQWTLLVQMAAVACAEVVEKWVGQTVRIKPPNDLMLGGGKLAGFLLETSNTWDFQVLGIGLNVRSAPAIEGYPTAAVEQFTGVRLSRTALAADLLNHFENGISISH